MKTKELIKKIYDLFLISEDATLDWINDTKLRAAWHVLFTLVLIKLMLNLILVPLFYDFFTPWFPNSGLGT